MQQYIAEYRAVAFCLYPNPIPHLLRHLSIQFCTQRFASSGKTWNSTFC